MLEQYYHIDKATGINLHFHADGALEINGCIVIIKNGKLDFEKKLIGLKSLEELSKHISPKSYIALNLTGKGILLKHTEKIEEINGNNFSLVLPNANPNDFYIQNYMSGAKSFISLIRKSEADKWMTRLQELGLVPLILSFGAFPVTNILPQLNIYGENIIFDGHQIITGEQQEWLSYRFDEAVRSPHPVKIESDIINEKLIIPYAIAFQLLLHSRLDVVNAYVETLEKKLTDTIAERKIKTYGFVTLMVFFVLLLINFIIFSSFNNENARLSQQASISSNNTSDINKLAEKIKNEEAILADLGWDGGLKKSKMVDELAAILPANVIWVSVQVNPVDDKASREQKATKFIDRKIYISGITDRMINVNEWIAVAKTLSWIIKIQLENYTYNNDKNTGEFKVTIDF